MACGTVGGFRGGLAAGFALGSLRPAPRDHRRGRCSGGESDRHDRARAGRRLSVAALPLRRSVRRNDHSDLQLGARPFERRGRARGDGGRLRRPAAGARRWGRGWAFDRGVCNVGHAARPVLHARCGAGPHRRFRNLAAHLGSESSSRAQESRSCWSPRSQSGPSSPPPIRPTRSFGFTPPAGAPPVRSTP